MLAMMSNSGARGLSQLAAACAQGMAKGSMGGEEAVLEETGKEEGDD